VAPRGTIYVLSGCRASISIFVIYVARLTLYPNPVLSRYRVGFDATLTTKPMGQTASGDWGVALSAGDVPPGRLLRYSIVLAVSGHDIGGVEGEPCVMLSNSLQGGAVPALFWYVEDPSKARGDVPTSSIVLFDARDGSGMRYYGNVSAHRTGSERHNGAC